MAITPFKVIQGYRFWYESKAHMRLPISEFGEITQTTAITPFKVIQCRRFWYNRNPICDCTVSKFWLIICQIFASDRGRFILTPSLGLIPANIRRNFTSP